jgi:predicted MFS family arabinose efflux permease
MKGDDVPLQQDRDSAHLSAARRATRLVFLVMGTATAAWAPMVPYVKAGLGLDDAQLGLLLLGLGGGGIAAMPIAGFLIHRFGSRAVVLVAGLLSCLLLPLASLAPSVFLLALTLVFFGAALGALDVATNAHAVVVEKQSARPLMSGFHALYSVGGLVGAGGMTFLLKLGLPLTNCAVGISVALLAIFLSQVGCFNAPSQESNAAGPSGLALPRGMVVTLGVLAFIVFMAEGAVLDWSAVLLRFSRGWSAETAGLGYAAFSVAMAFGRLTGDSLTRRMGPVAILRYGSLVCAAGFLVAVAAPLGGLSVFGFVLVGLGASNIVPVLFSAAGRLPGMPPSVAVPAVATLGYAGLLAGPALIGFAAQLTSLPLALAGLAALLLLVTVKAESARPATTSAKPALGDLP